VSAMTREMSIDSEGTIPRRVVWYLVEGDTEPMEVRFVGLVLSDYDSIALDVERADGTLFSLPVVPTATNGAVTDTTGYPCADQDGLTVKVTIDGGAEQMVTFIGVHTSVAAIVASMDTQLTGCAVTEVGGQVVITSDTKGTSSSVEIGAGTSALTWGTPVDGTGDSAAGEVTWIATSLVEGIDTGEFKFTIGAEIFTLPRKFPVLFVIRDSIG